MKILFTGGGSGGHFYPLIAVIQELKKIADEKNLIGLDIYFASTAPYNRKVLFDEEVSYIHIPSGKVRNYFSLLNYIDFFKTILGVLVALWKILFIFPDVIVGKGGYASYPVMTAAKILKIPLIIHESDSIPGRANEIASKYATRIAVSYPQAKEHFPKETQDKVAYTGHPVRDSIERPATEGAHEYLNLDPNIPTVFVVGGSMGAQAINEVILEALPNLVKEFQIIHQVGKKNLASIKETSQIILEGSEFANRYKVFDYLNDLALRMSAGASDVIVTRAGSTLFEIASWGRPAIVIPLPNSKNDHQRENAYEYAREGGAVVIEQKNLTASILTAEIRRIATDPELKKRMSEKAKEFSTPDAARTIAEEVLRIALSHLK